MNSFVDFYSLEIVPGLRRQNVYVVKQKCKKKTQEKEMKKKFRV